MGEDNKDFRRETLVMTRFVFTRFREGPMLGVRINLLLSLMTLTIGQFMKRVVSFESV